MIAKILKIKLTVDIYVYIYMDKYEHVEIDLMGETDIVRSIRKDEAK